MFKESSYRAIQNYKLLCAIKDNNGEGVCESGDEGALTDIVKNVFVDEHSGRPYNFKYNPPILNGQTGVPQVVDGILGESIIQCALNYLLCLKL